MILTCPECATRFSAESEAIGPNGRTVRCSQCSATWFASADPDILSLNEIQNTAALADVIKDADQIEDTASKFVEGNPSESEPHAVLRDMAERKKVRRRLFWVGMIWLTTLLLLTVTAVIAFLLRAQIVEKFPSKLALYEAVGVEASETGLIIHKILTAYGDVDGTPVLFINGEIKNYDLQARDVPLVQINFKNDNGEILENWVIEPAKSILKNGESQAFSSQYPNPPVDATKLEPVFIDERVGTSAQFVPQ